MLIKRLHLEGVIAVTKKVQGKYRKVLLLLVTSVVMAQSTRVKKVVELQNENLNWGINPLLFWMKIIGIPHYMAFEKSKLSVDIFWKIYQFTLWILVIAAHFSLYYTAIISNSYLTFYPKTRKPGDIPTTRSWNILITYTNRK